MEYRKKEGVHTGTPLQKQRLNPSVIVIVMLGLMSLACWSSDTLIIKPTVTPLPTQIPPTLDSSAAAGKYTIGDSVTIVTGGIAPLYITTRPEPATRSNRVPNAACYKDTVVKVEAVQQADGIIYYQITCNNLPGWVSEKLLSGGK